MGMNKLDEIISIYQNNRTDDLPVAIIQNGTKDSQKKAVGTISTISKMVKEQQLSSPAIIIIGEVVKNASQLTSYFKGEYSDEEFVLQNLDVFE
ncbi:Uroporphyrinogen-III C-methyltransferase [compost metagenome]